MTAKVAPTTVKLNKSVTVSGTVTPAAQLAGAKVSILVNRKVGTKWVKAKAATVTASRDRRLLLEVQGHQEGLVSGQGQRQGDRHLHAPRA